jgi:hypothetical protein
VLVLIFTTYARQGSNLGLAHTQTELTRLSLALDRIFELVFTFNPSKTNALMHSVPFIGNQTSIALFMISQARHASPRSHATPSHARPPATQPSSHSPDPSPDPSPIP